MKPIIRAFAVSLAFGAGAARPAEFFEPYQPARTVQPMAHRGMAASAPENTAAAIELAIQLGVEWVELDIRLTRDGHHVLFHDETLDAKSDGTGRVAGHTLAEIRSLDAGFWFAPRFAGQRILPLPEALRLCKGRINIYLDCKAIDPERLTREVMDAGMERQTAVYAGPATLGRIREQSAAIPLMAKCASIGQLERLAEGLGVAVIEIDPERAAPELLAAARERGIRTQIKALGAHDTPGHWERFIELGADYIQTDDPAGVQAVYHRRVMRGGRPCMVSAHRGACLERPENTRSAIGKAIQLGCEFVEIDARTGADGRLVIMHDSTALRTAGLDEPVRNLTLSRLRELSAGRWFGKPYEGETVLTLEEVIEQTRGRIRLYVDNKDTDPVQLAEALRRGGVAGTAVIFGGVDELAALREAAPELKLMPPLSRIEQIGAVFNRLEPYAFDAKWDALSPGFIEACHARGVKVFSDAMGGRETLGDYAQAIEWGIDLIQTDNPPMVNRAMEIHAAGRAGK